MESVVEMNYRLLEEMYRGKRVLITGHTGFKGSWLCVILKMMGAEVTGYALEPNVKPSLFELAGIAGGIDSVIGDVRDMECMKKVFDVCRPEFVFHLAAQPIVREGYRCPADTYETNVMGTVNLMECVCLSDSVKSVVNVTTDKVYQNLEVEKGYVEEDKLDGSDPYSNSSELVTHSYVSSFLQEQNKAVSTCRAGNVIGGGDFEKDRIIPDCVRAVVNKEALIVRNPLSVRPYQHVLEPLFAYLMIAAGQLQKPGLAGAYNIGPDVSDCLTTGRLVDIFQSEWGEGFTWKNMDCGGPHEANLLKLDCSKLKAVFGWRPRYSAKKAVGLVTDWTKVWLDGEDIRACMERQIRDYIGCDARK